MTRLAAEYGTVVELFYAHGLRQGPATLSSTGFAVHQDTEDYPFIEFTVVVKLTPDREGERPSAMRVVGAERHFSYGAHAGASGSFRARVHHASVVRACPGPRLAPLRLAPTCFPIRAAFVAPTCASPRAGRSRRPARAST